jgi:hypothetical protein
MTLKGIDQSWPVTEEQYMALHFVGTANDFVYYPYLKKARSAPAHYVHGSVAGLVAGIFTAAKGDALPEAL